MIRRSLLALTALMVPLVAHAQLAGTWTGSFNGPGGAQPVTMVLDSSAAGWSGSMLSSIQPTPVPFGSVTRSGDSLYITFEVQGANVEMSGKVVNNGIYTAQAFFEGNAVGSMRVTRDGYVPPAAPAPTGAAAKPVGPNTNPDGGHFITTDIQRFWRVFDSATALNAISKFQIEYLDAGTPGLRDFTPNRIGNGLSLAGQVANERARYEAVRASTLAIGSAEPAIRQSFRKLKELYRAAVFPDVYFVVGRFNTGGTSSEHGIIIASELYKDPAGLPAIVSHELVHFQQPTSSNDETLLTRAFREGSADFIGQMIAAGNINKTAYDYGKAHEHQLWAEFTKVMHGKDYYPWMYAKPEGKRPNDLGYYLGYRIAEAYYRKASDKSAALHDIISATDIDALLTKSGYAP